jgi:hypothetical protein
VRARARASTYDRSRLPLLPGFLLAAFLLLGASPAHAAKSVHSFFGSDVAGAGAGQLNTPRGVAVNSPATVDANDGDIYVVDGLNNRVAQYSSTHTFIRAWGWNVSPDAEPGDTVDDKFEICTTTCQIGTAGAGAGQLSGAQGIAVDQATGNLYVSSNTNARVDVFGANGGLQGAFGAGVLTGAATTFEFCSATCLIGKTGAAAGQFGSATGYLAVDPTNGDVLLANRTNRRIDRFDPTLTAGVVTGASYLHSFGWGVDTNTGVFEVCTIASTCNAGVTTSPGNPGQFANNEPTRVAVDSTGAVYAVEASASGENLRRVHKFTPQVGPPEYLPSAFADGVLGAKATGAQPTDVAIGAADKVLVVKLFPIGAGSPPATSAERRVLELDSTGTLLDTHMVASTINAVNGLAANPTSGRLYVASTTGGQRVYALDTVLAPSATIDPVTDQTATTATFKGTVNPNGVSTGYRFEYSIDGGATWEVTTKPDIALGSGSSPVAVESARTGLLPNTNYKARLLAAHPFGAGTTTTAPVEFTTTAQAPAISTAASVAGEETAELHSLVDPRGSNVTACEFEWGTTASYGNSVPCDALPGAGQGWKLVSATVIGLTKGATYHYRLIATSTAGTTKGPDRAIEVGTQLPDNRAWEMVSPPEKNGGDVMVHTQRVQAAVAGDAMQFSSLSAFAGALGTGVSTDYVAVRDEAEGRWETHAITPPQESMPLQAVTHGKDPIYEGDLAPDLSKGLVRVNPSDPPLTAGAPNVTKLQNLYLRDDLRTPGAGSYTLMSDSLAPQPTVNDYSPRFAAASNDYSHVVFDSTLNLTADASGNDFKAYEWVDNGATGTVRLAGVLPDGSPAPSSSGEKGVRAYRPETISDDGSSILFTSPAGLSGQLYMRIDGTSTVHLNKSEKTAPEGPQAARFQVAAADHSRIFFITSAHLIDADTDNCVDLYMYDATLPESDPHNLTRISEDKEPADGVCAGLSGVMGASADGQTIYFFASKQMVPGASLGPVGSGLMYMWRDGELRYIGSVADSGSDVVNNNIADDGGVNLNPTNARVTPDGDHLLFQSRSGEWLTGHHHGTCGSEGCRQFYLYDAEATDSAEALVCISCRPNGAPSTTNASQATAVANGGANSGSRLPEPLSVDGRFVSFDTGEALVPHDTNGRRDVYRYDAEGGQLSLLSGGGEESGDSYFLDASANGEDVFFGSRSQLSGWDFDQAFDIYDARVDGGLPEPPAPAPACIGDACQPSPMELSDATPSSSSFSGSGNQSSGRPISRRCPKGKRAVKARGKTRCVKRQDRKGRANENRRAGR